MIQKSTILPLVCAAVVATLMAVFIWWIVTGQEEEEFVVTVPIDGDGYGNITQTAAFTQIQGTGSLFWWFYPSTADQPQSKPIIIWLGGVLGMPPSLLANIGMIGPFDFNQNKREHTWLDEYNLLFVDAPLGTGFSTVSRETAVPETLQENLDHLSFVLGSFYSLNEDFKESELCVFGEGDGAQLAISYAMSLVTTRFQLEGLVSVAENLPLLPIKCLVLGNGVISPAATLGALGNYMEELGYVDSKGREAIDTLSQDVNDLMAQERNDEAFELFQTLEELVNENSGATAVNLQYIVQKLAQSTTLSSGQKRYLEKRLQIEDPYTFMETTVANALGFKEAIQYDGGRAQAVHAFRNFYMKPSIEDLEYILQYSNLTVSVYNGNLDGISNTPGQIKVIENLQWYGQQEFQDSPRQALILNNQIEGYFRETSRLRFYWVNVAGHSAPLDNPDATRWIVNRTMK